MCVRVCGVLQNGNLSLQVLGGGIRFFFSPSVIATITHKRILYV